MVVVVPAFAHREQSEQKIVARIVARDISRATAHVSERIDTERRVIDEDRAPDKADYQARPSCNEEAQPREGYRRQKLEFMQKPQFRKTEEVRNLTQVSRIVPAGKDPSDMAVEKSVVPRGMRVVFGIGMQMVMTVHCSPP
jgi:hypothetical protein